jgi:hypothetical protein
MDDAAEQLADEQPFAGPATHRLGCSRLFSILCGRLQGIPTATSWASSLGVPLASKQHEHERERAMNATHRRQDWAPSLILRRKQGGANPWARLPSNRQTLRLRLHVEH